MLEEFKAFLTKTNALALAIGVIIGAAAGKIVTKMVEDIIMPIIGLVLPAGDWREAQYVLKEVPDPKNAGKMLITAIRECYELSERIYSQQMSTGRAIGQFVRIYKAACYHC